MINCRADTTFIRPQISCRPEIWIVAQRSSHELTGSKKRQAEILMFRECKLVSKIRIVSQL